MDFHTWDNIHEIAWEFCITLSRFKLVSSSATYDMADDVLIVHGIAPDWDWED